MVEKVDAVVVGAGVVGLAAARKLVQSGLEVVVLEAASAIGTEISSHNSGVIHAGIYYPRESLKARLCIRGKELLYDYCEQRNIPHQRTGKLIVATSESQEETLVKLAEKGRENGVEDLKYFSSDEVSQIEPNINAVSALYSPSTGIVDTGALMLSYQGEIESAGGILALNAPVEATKVRAGVFRVEIGGADPMLLDTELLVNSTGLHMAKTMASIEGFPQRCIPVIYYAKGNYFRFPVEHLSPTLSIQSLKRPVWVSMRPWIWLDKFASAPMSSGLIGPIIKFLPNGLMFSMTRSLPTFRRLIAVD